MDEVTHATEVTVTRDLRQRANTYHRAAQVYDRDGLHRAAARNRVMAAGMREMALLVESAPFEVGTSGPGAGVLVAHTNRRMNNQ